LIIAGDSYPVFSPLRLNLSPFPSAKSSISSNYTTPNQLSDQSFSSNKEQISVLEDVISFFFFKSLKIINNFFFFFN
jgi:catabolite regulation protein CreA